MGVRQPGEGSLCAASLVCYLLLGELWGFTVHQVRLAARGLRKDHLKYTKIIAFCARM